VTAKQIINKVKDLVDHYMHWTDDKFAFDKPEYWTSWAWKIEELEKSGRFELIRDDCDGFALTSAALLIKAGIPEADVNICFCEVPRVGFHLICIVNDGERDYVLCNNHSTPIPKSACDYKLISIMNYGKVGTWVAVS